MMHTTHATMAQHLFVSHDSSTCAARHCITFGAIVHSHRIQVDVAAEAVHVEHQSVVDEIHREPNAQEAERDQTQIFGTEQLADAGHVLFLVGWGLEQFVQIVR